MCLSKTGLKIFMLILNVIFFLCGGVLMGVGIWAVVDKLYLSDIVGNNLFKSAAYLMVVSGVVLVLISFLGCIAAITSNKRVIFAAMISLIVIFILLMTTAILGAVFQDEVEGELKERMKQTLKEKYGFYTERNEENLRVTEAWDDVQRRLECCAVDNEGWWLYKQSNWFYNQYQYDQKFVPVSCCVYADPLNQYLNVAQCQNYMGGPPTTNRGSHNNALNYQGCYDVVRDFIGSQSTLILGVGFAFCVFLLTGIVISIMFLRAVPAHGRSELIAHN